MITPISNLGTLGKVCAGVLSLSVALGLSGCISVLPKAKPHQIYRLDAPIDLGSEGLEEARLVLIERPIAPRALINDKIALAYPDGRIAYAAQSNWVSPVPALIQDRVMDAYAAEIPEIAAVRSEDGVRARWALRLEVRHFEALFDQGEDSAPLVRVMMRARIVDEQERSLISSRTVESEVRARSRTVSAIVEAFDGASTEVSRTLVTWSRDVLAAQPQEGDAGED
ncbi:ABC-type transport auxiliary lipoprotein family protein [Woodsholea maritima]|uniref:ABC-type transport auxiliary lipoprotein family protein n=1 Tax=Woodsholea maritima TaxID=240237 RepID=UPI000380AE71|nr:ABC-type transport auxiliary lipoprotein family protein [Woodsholea maritima]